MKPLILLLFGALSAFADPFSFGIKAGLPLTEFVDTVDSGRFRFTSSNHHYIVGPSFELRLPAGLGIEVDALYRRIGYEGSGNAVDVYSTSRTTGNAWEFPVLGKYRFPGLILHPYLSAGVAFDNLSGVEQTITRTVIPTQITTTTTQSPAELKNTTTTGFVIGGGVEIKALLIRLTPEVRYTRWGSQHFTDINGLIHSNQNQAEFLLGISF